MDADLQYFRIACKRLAALSHRVFVDQDGGIPRERLEALSGAGIARAALGKPVRREEDQFDRDVELAMALSLSDRAPPSTLVQADDEDTVALHRAIELSLSSTDWYPDDPENDQ